MKKILPLLMLFMFSCYMTKADTEPGNNTPGTTTDVLPLNGSQSGTIGSTDTDDYYKLATNADGNITVSLSNTDNAYTYIYLYDSDGTTQLGTVSGYGQVDINFTVNGLAVGNYFVRVYSTNATASSYTLSNSLAADAVPIDIEPNDDFTQALTIAPNGTKTGHIAYRKNGGGYDSDDYYKVTTTTDGNITVHLSNDNNGYEYIYLYDNDGTTQLGQTSGYAQAGISFTVNGLSAGSYYIRVYTSALSYYSGYTLSNTITPATLTNDAEPDDLYTQAITIAPNTSKTGHIGYRYNGGSFDGYDYYKVTTTTDGDITVNLSNDNNGYTYIYLYDNDGTTQLGTTSGYSQAGISFTVHGRAASTYYILVYTSALSYYSSYTLSTSTTSTVYNDTEPNNTVNQALAINEDDSVKGHIGYVYNGGAIDGYDYYKLITTKDGNINISLNNDNNGYTYIYLYDNDGTTQLGTTSGYALNGIGFTANGLAAGTYYVLVYTNTNAYYTSYTLHNLVTPAAFTNDTEPNNDFASATILNNDSAKSGHICYRSNGGAIDYSDYRKVIMYTSGSLGIDVTMANTSYSYVYLYNPAQGQIYLQQGYNSSYSIDFPNLAAGTYYLLVYSSSSSYFNSYKITRFQVPCNQDASNITAGGPTTFCAGGSVTLHSTIEYATYAWSNGATTRDITVSTTGNYSLLGTDYDGCATHASNSIGVTVNPVPATPTISTGGATTTFCQGGSVTLTSSAAAGNTWSTNATTQAITVSTSGSYTVAVTAIGCTSASSASTVVTVNPLPTTPTISAGGPTTFCAGGSVTLTSSAATSNLWSTGATTQSIIANATGNYSVTVKNANNCSATSAVTAVTVNPLPATPTISAGGPTTFCAGGSVTLTSSSVSNNLWSNGVTTQSITVNATGNYSVTVTNANNCSATSAVTAITVNPLPTVALSPFTAVCSTDAAFTLTGGSPAGGTYSGTGVSAGQFNPATAGVGSFPITYSYTNANNCPATAQQSITVNNCTAPCNASITAGGPTTFCAGGSVILTASAGVSWLWSNNATTQSITVSSTGNYSCAVTNASNCTATAPAVSVTANPLPATPTISAGGSTTFCAGGTVTLTSSSATNNLWSNAATTQSITVNATGNYSVTVSNANGCSATSAATGVTVNPLPTVTLGQFAAVCSTDAAFALSGGSPAGGTYSGTGVSGGQFNPATAGLGTFTITYSYTNANNCSATAQQSITVNNCNPQCTATATAGGPITFCAGGNVVLTASAGVSYLWSNGSSSASITVSTSGNYSVAVTNANNCTATSNVIVVTVNPLPTVALSVFAAKCSTDAAFVLTGGSPAGGTYSGTGVSGGQFNPATAGVGTFPITYSYTNANGCSATATQSITVNNCTVCTATITANGATTFCSGGSVKLTASAGSSYLWSNGSTASNITVTTGGSFTVKVTQSNGCFATSAATVVTVNALPSVPTITAGGPTTFCTPGSVTLTSSAATGNTWSNGATTQSITVTSSGSYTVKVTNANGCSATSAASVVTANNCGGTYCTANGTIKTRGYINNVRFRSINNTSGWNGGYGNFTNLSATVNKSTCYSISVSPGFQGCSSPLYTRVWIDWNHDGDFNDAGELVFAPAGSSSGTRNGSVNVPCHALCGATRMRVEMRADCNPSPCGTFTYGEVEDYTVIVSCSTGSKGIEEDKTGDIILSESFTVYPNPVSDEMLIRRSSNDNTTIVDADARLIIADMNGKIVLQSTLRKSTEIIDVRKWAPGIYVVQIKTINGTTTKKVVVSH